MIERMLIDVVQNTPAWEKWRNNYHSRFASQAPTVIGANPYATAADLWQMKQGLKTVTKTPASPSPASDSVVESFSLPGARANKLTTSFSSYCLNGKILSAMILCVLSFKRFQCCYGRKPQKIFRAGISPRGKLFRQSYKWQPRRTPHRQELLPRSSLRQKPWQFFSQLPLQYELRSACRTQPQLLCSYASKQH